MARYLLGVDIGTSVIKSTLFDLHGVEVAGASQEVLLLHPVEGWVELDMEAVWRSVQETLRSVVATANRAGWTIAAIGVTGQGDGTWLVGRTGAPVRHAISWLDGRTAEMVSEAHANGQSEQLFAITGTALNTANQALHLRWLQQNEAESLGRAAAALRAKDWVFLRLTGVVSTDESDASHTWFNIRQRALAPELFALLGIADCARLIPLARVAHENIAPILAAVADDLALARDTPVVAGPFDVAASDLGAGVLQPGDACTILGTAGIHQVVIDHAIDAPHNIGYTMAHAPAGRLVRLLPTMTGTLNLQWFARAFFRAEMDAAVARDENPWAQLEEIAASVALGCDGVMYHPYIDAAGERAPFVRPDARAQFTGLCAHHTPAVLLRAVYEGVILSALDCYSRLGEIRTLTLTGGGARSPFWAQMLADALGCSVQTVQGTESGARGAAMTAGVAIDLFSSYEEAAQAMVHPGRSFAPDLAKTSCYHELLAMYQETRLAMHPVWEARAAWRKRYPWKGSPA